MRLMINGEERSFEGIADGDRVEIVQFVGGG